MDLLKYRLGFQSFDFFDINLELSIDFLAIFVACLLNDACFIPKSTAKSVICIL